MFDLLPGTVRVPGIDLCLQIVALCQQRAVAGREFAEQRGKTLPESACIPPERGKDIGFDEGGQRRVDFDTGARHVFCHGTPLGMRSGNVDPGRSEVTYAASG